MAVNDYGSAQAYNLEQTHHLLLVVFSPNDIARPFAPPEFPPVLQRTPGSTVYGYHIYPFVSKLLLNLTQGWSLQPTGGSTREGEVEDYYITLVIAQRERSFLAGAYREVRCHWPT